MLIDSHAHLDFYDDPAPILAAAQAAGVGQILAIGIGQGPDTMHRALEFAHQHTIGGPQIWASAGIHPQEAAHATPEALAKLTSLAEDPRCIAIGFYLSFAGNLTYPKSTTIQHVAASAPSDRILVETDAPFLAPVPYRGQQNHPALVVHTAAFLADLRHTTPEAIAQQTTSNFHTLFPITRPEVS